VPLSHAEAKPGADHVAYAVLDRLSMGTLPYPGDQLIDATMARSLHADACRDHALVGVTP